MSHSEAARSRLDAAVRRHLRAAVPRGQAADTFVADRAGVPLPVVRDFLDGVRSMTVDDADAALAACGGPSLQTVAASIDVDGASEQHLGRHAEERGDRV